MNFTSGRLGTGASAPKPLSLAAKAKKKKTAGESLGEVISGKPKISKTGNRPAAKAPAKTGRIGGGGKL